MRLEKLSVNDGSNIYQMLQRIGANENEFKNTAHGLSFEEYQRWLIEQSDWSEGKNLPEGYVPQTIYWLYDEQMLVGIGKIRHRLNDHSRVFGGNIGYAIDPLFRGKGYATILLRLLLIQAKELDVPEIILSVENYNIPSRCVIERNGGVLLSENDKRRIYSIKEMEVI